MNMVIIWGGVWGVVVIGLLLVLLRLSYRIERRSNPEKFKRWPMRYANPIGTALNINVARDAETQGLRKKLLLILMIISALMVAFALVVIVILPQ